MTIITTETTESKKDIQQLLKEYHEAHKAYEAKADASTFAAYWFTSQDLLAIYLPPKKREMEYEVIPAPRNRRELVARAVKFIADYLEALRAALQTNMGKFNPLVVGWSHSLSSNCFSFALTAEEALAPGGDRRGVAVNCTPTLDQKGKPYFQTAYRYQFYLDDDLQGWHKPL